MLASAKSDLLFFPPSDVWKKVSELSSPLCVSLLPGTAAILNTSLHLNWRSLISTVTCYLTVATRMAALFSAFACALQLVYFFSTAPVTLAVWQYSHSEAYPFDLDPLENIGAHSIRWILPCMVDSWSSLFLSVLSILSVWLMLDLFDGHTSSLERTLSSFSAPHHKQHVNSFDFFTWVGFPPPAFVPSKKMCLCRCVCAQDTRQSQWRTCFDIGYEVMFRASQALKKTKKGKKDA